VLFQALDDPATARFYVIAEFLGIVLARFLGFLYFFLLLGDVIFASRRQLVCMLLEALSNAPFTRLHTRNWMTNTTRLMD